MKKQIFISLLIVAFFNFINGCAVTKSERITPDKLIFNKEVIEGVVKLDLDVINFNKDGGRFLDNQLYVGGQLKDGSELNIPVNQIRELRTSTVKSVKPEDVNNRKIREIFLNNDILVSFNEDGGIYNEKNKTITGVTDLGNEYKVGINKVSEIHLEKPEVVDAADLTNKKDIIISQVIDNLSSTAYTYDHNGGKILIQNKKIRGITIENKLVSIDVDSILYVNVKRTNVAGTILSSVAVVILGLAVVAVVIAATKQSCPFIYSYDGNKYVFDAEPLGGATTKGLERTEYSKMEYLKKVDNGYKILVRNEVEETQYLDELTLLAVKHDKDKEVIPDLKGNFYQIKNLVTPVSAKDENGLDLKKIVSINDNLYWQSKLPVDDNLISKNSRQELTFTFLKPKDKSKAKLVANIGTSLWGSKMIREMLQLYGNSVDDYYDKIDEQGSSYDQLMSFIETEELYKLKYYTKNGDKWTFQGYINGGGPLISETRVYNLDLSNIKGDSVTIKMNPPFGFWTVDYLAVQYDEFDTPVITTMPFQSAVNQDGSDLRQLITSTDNKYYTMPKVGDYFEAVYSEPKNIENSNITYYLKSSGYYQLHLDKSAPIQFNILGKFLTDPGYIIQYSNDKYRSWVKSNNQ